MSDVAGDCVHPTHGKFGTDYLTDLVVHWLEGAPAANPSATAANPSAPAAHDNTLSQSASTTTTTTTATTTIPAAPTAPLVGATTDVTDVTDDHLPPPLHSRVLNQARTTTACYFVDSHSSGRASQPQSKASTWMSVPWRSAYCPTPAAFAASFGGGARFSGSQGARPTPATLAASFDGGAGSMGGSALQDGGEGKCVMLRHESCHPRASYQQIMRMWAPRPRPLSPGSDTPQGQQHQLSSDTSSLGQQPPAGGVGAWRGPRGWIWCEPMAHTHTAHTLHALPVLSTVCMCTLLTS